MTRKVKQSRPRKPDAFERWLVRLEASYVKDLMDDSYAIEDQYALRMMRCVVIETLDRYRKYSRRKRGKK